MQCMCAVNMRVFVGNVNIRMYQIGLLPSGDDEPRLGVTLYAVSYMRI